MTTYVMQAKENYPADIAARLDADDVPVILLSDQILGMSYDRVNRKFFYLQGVAETTPTTTNATGHTLWDGENSYAPGDPYETDVDEYIFKDLFVTVKDLATGAITAHTWYNGAFTVPNGIGGSDGTWRRLGFDMFSGGNNLPSIVNPRNQDFWVSAGSCELYQLRATDSYALAISPLFPVLNRNDVVRIRGITADWCYATEHRSAVVDEHFYLVPTTFTAAEIAADYKLIYADYTMPSAAKTSWYNTCLDKNGNCWIFGANKSGARQFFLWKFTPPSAFVYPTPPVDGGVTDVTPWSSSTGPNTNVSSYHTFDSYSNLSKSVNAMLLMQLPATNELVAISKLFAADAGSTDPNDTRFDCAYVDISGAPTFDYHAGFVTGYMTAAWAPTSDPMTAAWSIIDVNEVNGYLQFSDFAYDDDYTKRWFFFICNPVESGSVGGAKRRVIVQYQFVSGAAPVVLQVITEQGWDDAYTTYATAISNTNVVNASMVGRTGIEFQAANGQYLDQGVWDEATASWWWSGLNSNIFQLDAAFTNRAAFSAPDVDPPTIMPPLLRLALSASTRPGRSGGDLTRVRAPSVSVYGQPPATLDPGSFFPGTPFTAIGGAGGPYLWSGGDTLPPGMFVNPVTGVLGGTPDAAGSYTVTITATDKAGTSGDFTFTLVIGDPAAPVCTVSPAITGTPLVGETLACSLGTWLNAPTSFIRQWYRNDVVIPSATAATYLLVEADLATNIKCIVTASNVVDDTPAPSNTVGPVIETSAPVNTSAPVVTGSAVQGSTLTTTNGIWANTPTGFTYQWQSNGVDIGGATSSTYDSVLGDIGDFIGCVVTASNAGGSTDKESNTVGPIIAGSPYAVFSPKLADVTLYRTMVVDAGDEAIDLQAEVGLPYSPTATSWTIAGTSAANWEQLTTGALTVKSASRSAVKGTTQHLTVQAHNAAGDSDLIDLSVVVFADADSRFVDFDSGSDGASGLTPATAWKRLPRTPGSSNTTTLTSKGVFFKGGVRYKGQLTASNGTSQTSHAGAPGAPMVFSGTGWGGQAIMDGADNVGSWSAASSPEVFGNPNWASIEKVTLGSALQSYQQLFCGETMCYPAQYPTPADLIKFEGLQLGAQGDPSQGCAQAHYTTSGAVTTKPRLYRPSAGTVCYIVDDALNAQFNNTSVAYNANGIGRWVLLWCPGNNASIVPVQQFDAGTNTLTCDAGTTSINSTGGFTSYGLIMSPYAIDKAGQYALSADGLTLYAWRPNTDQASVSQRALMTSIGSGSDNIVYAGMQVERYSGGSNRNGSYTYGGITAFNFFSTASSANVLSNLYVRQMRADGGEGCGYYGISSGGLTGSTLERFTFDECPRSSAFRLGNIFSSGFVQYNYVMDEGIGRTFLLLTKSDSVMVQGNMGVNLSSTHGNFFSAYTDAVGSYTTNLTFENNLCDNVERAFTTSVGITPTNRNNLITRNIFLARGESATVDLFSGDKGSTYSSNIIMGATGYSYPFAAYIDDGGDSTGGVIFTDNIVAAFGWDTSHLATSSWTITDNLMTVNTLPPSGTNKTVSGNTVAAGAPIVVWDKTITPAMAAVLGAGALGIFWSV